MTCVDCGAQAPKRRANAKRCDSCRLLTWAIYGEDAKLTPECMICEKPFAPTPNHKKWHLACNPYQKVTGRFTCPFCDQADQPRYYDLNICWNCINDPETRPKLIRGLIKGQKSRRDENDR